MRLPLIALALIASVPALAGSVAARLPVVVYDGPSENSTPRYLIGKDYPVVVISETSSWLKICLHGRDTGYLQRRDVVPGNNVVVLRPTSVRHDPAPDGGVVLRADAELLLTGTGDPIGGWLPVRHDSGAAGFVELRDVWGHSGC